MVRHYPGATGEANGRLLEKEDSNHIYTETGCGVLEKSTCILTLRLLFSYFLFNIM
jgi:hypothetical protein